MNPKTDDKGDEEKPGVSGKAHDTNFSYALLLFNISFPAR